MSKTQSNNKQIAKNTLFLYSRTLLTLIVGLYTSRVVLSALGIEDYGIYNVVGGVVVLFTFISNAMATGTQRHLSYELGKPDGNVSKIFSTCFYIHQFIALIILILSETIGLWFINTQLNLPDNRMEAVNWCYQMSILTCLAGIIRVPHNAAIIAYEKMSFYAYVGIIEAVLKLLIVYLIIVSDVDKLILYSILILLVTVFINAIYWIYCASKITDIHIAKVNDKQVYREMLSFSGWSLFGSMSNVGQQQGVNIIVNLFYGVTLNAAVGIANQINSHVSQFVSGFQQALNPQLTKSEAANDRGRQMDLIYKSSKFSFLIMLLISYPLMMNLPYILSLWLGKYPTHTVEICVWIMIGVLITCLSGPLWVTIYATGRIKVYQIVVSSVALLVLPLSYVGGKFGMSAEGMFIVRALDYIVVLSVQLLFLKSYIKLGLRAFFKNVILQVSLVSAICLSFTLLTKNVLLPSETFLTLIWQTILYIFICGISIYIIGFNSQERQLIKNLIFKVLKIKK